MLLPLIVSILTRPTPAAATTEPTIVFTAADATRYVRIKDTNYPIPNGAFFVAPNGNDANAGTQAKPWRTIKKAVTTAPSGSTIVLRQGAYHETVVIRDKALTLQPYPHEQVWLKGSVVVRDWVKDGAVWRKDGWTHRFPQGDIPPDFLDRRYPMAAAPDMVFIDGMPLAQVGSKDQVTAGTFFVDYGSQQLFIGIDPTGKRVEVSALAQALLLNQSHNTKILGLGFMHYATSVNQYGAVRGDADGLVFENNTFVHNASTGLSVLGANGSVRDNIFAFNGLVGLHGHEADRLVAERNIITYNNNEQFKWAAGGAKVAKSRDVVIRDNLVERNWRQGLWCDVSTYNIAFVRNVVRYNTYRGIMAEISAKVIIASNVVTDNGRFGIFVFETEDVDVYNNTLSRNTTNIRVLEDTRTSTEDPLITMDVRDVVIKNNILSNGSDIIYHPSENIPNVLLSVNDKAQRKTAEQMGVVVDYNAYYRTNNEGITKLAEWARWPGGLLTFNYYNQYRTKTGMEAHGIGIGNSATNPFFVDEANGNYRLKPNSVAIKRGEPLPSNVAAAIGVQPGVPVNLGALKWWNGSYQP